MICGHYKKKMKKNKKTEIHNWQKLAFIGVIFYMCRDCGQITRKIGKSRRMKILLLILIVLLTPSKSFALPTEKEVIRAAYKFDNEFNKALLQRNPTLSVKEIYQKNQKSICGIYSEGLVKIFSRLGWWTKLNKTPGHWWVSVITTNGELEIDATFRQFFRAKTNDPRDFDKLGLPPIIFVPKGYLKEKLYSFKLKPDFRNKDYEFFYGGER
jgi:hypothetical protein